MEVWTTVNGQTTSWTYDGLGNRVSEYRYRGTGAYQELAYYPNTNLIQRKGIWSFNYDANGNLIERGTAGTWNAAADRYDWSADSGELWRYEYDLKNRLIEVKRGKAGADSLKIIATYAYDNRDLQIMTTKVGTTTYYQYDQSGDLVWTESGGENTKYVQALGQVWAEIRTESGESAVYYHHTDHLGTTELVTDEGGTVVWSGSYEAYGSVSRSNGSLEFTPSYTGKQLDEDTALTYFNARWYDPKLGRFMSEDPARDGDNWVAYVNNRPLSATDPTGLIPLLAYLANAAAGAGIGAATSFVTEVIGNYDGDLVAATQKTLHGSDSLKRISIAAAAGATSGAIGSGLGLISGLGGKVLASAATGGAVAAERKKAENTVSGKTTSLKESLTSYTEGAIISAAVPLLSNGVEKIGSTKTRIDTGLKWDPFSGYAEDASFKITKEVTQYDSRALAAAGMVERATEPIVEIITKAATPKEPVVK